MFLPGQVVLTSFRIRVPFQSLNLQLCGNCFVMEDLRWGIEQHLIKSMFVFCLTSSLLFSALSLHIQEKRPLHHNAPHIYRRLRHGGMNSN